MAGGGRLIALAALVSVAAAAGPPPWAEMMKQQAQDGFSGSVLIARGDTVIYREAFGFANRARAQPNRPETVFRIGSVTKTLTAVLTLALAAEEHWSLEEPVGRRWPGLPEAWRRLTPHWLLCHQAGLAEFTRLPGFDRGGASEHAVERLRGLIGDRPLDFEPGTSASYSNSNYVLLGGWLEQVTERSYADLLQEHVLRPAGMEFTAESTPSNHAVGYEPHATAWRPVAERDPSILDAAGSLVSNVDDLWRFVRALRDGKILGPVDGKLLEAPRSPDFSYGWRRRTAFGREISFQPGMVRGFTSVIMQVPEDDLVVIVLANRSPQNAPAVALELVRVLVEARVQGLIATTERRAAPAQGTMVISRSSRSAWSTSAITQSM